MFNSDEFTKAALSSGENYWELLDSFWRQETEASTRQLVRYESIATWLAWLNLRSKSAALLANQSVVNAPAQITIPWFPLVVYRSKLVEGDFYLYDGTVLYTATPTILYGQTTSNYVNNLVTDNRLVDVPMLCDSVTTTTVVINQSQFSYDSTSGVIAFTVDPFSLIPAKVNAESGEDYIVLWVKNPGFNLRVNAGWIGWPIQFPATGQPVTYNRAVKVAWETVIRGPSCDRYRRGLLDSLDFPYALAAETVRRVDDDGFYTVIQTDGQAYSCANNRASSAVAPGDQLEIGTPLTDGVSFLEFPATTSVTATLLCGIVLPVPLSTGQTASLSFANVDTDWTYDVGRPSPWRFPVGGNAAEVEQYWVDVGAYATANSVDFEVLYDLLSSTAVNPLYRVIEDLLRNNLYVASVDLTSLAGSPSGFQERMQQLLSPSGMAVLHQRLGNVTDEYDVGSETSDSVGYGYNAVATTEVISVSGTDLTYYDYTPLVVAS